MKKFKFDFSGYATKNDLKCTDGRIIRKDAFKHADGTKVPLVWQHDHNDPTNVLGHAILENREDGVYTYGVFNDSEAAKNAKMLVHHGDITALSIYANQLVQKGSDVVHGAIREVSLVLAGANPGAFIDNLSLGHSDGDYAIDETEAIIYTGLSIGEEIEHSDEKEEDEESLEHAEDATIKEVFDTLNEDQKTAVYAIIAHALGEEETDDEEAEHADSEGEEITHSNSGGEIMKKNIFENKEEQVENTLTHAQISAIFTDAMKMGSLKEAVLTHAGTYGIDNIDVLFPDAAKVRNAPDFVSRRMEWVSGIISGTHHTPFSRIKSMTADITVETARARGYVKGNLKKEEVFALLSRTTTPTTIYKKQKLDRDDIIDITDLDVVAWLKAEMRMMLEEEIARAILIGDGRDVASEDKIDETKIRPVYKDDDMYAHKVKLTGSESTLEKIEAIIRARKNYKGTGRPNFYTTADELTEMLLVKDTTNRRLYKTQAELESDLRVNAIIEVEVMEGVNRLDTDETTQLDLVGIMFNPKDYTVGADKGGKLSMFDDFDIDYNQYKYLIEGRMSGALTRPKSAIVIEEVHVAG